MKPTFHLSLLLVAASVPLGHRVIDIWSSTESVSGGVTYCCDSPGTTTAYCASLGLPKCPFKKTVCKSQAETGNTINCNDGSGSANTNCKMSNQCNTENDAETHNCNPPNDCPP